MCIHCESCQRYNAMCYIPVRSQFVCVFVFVIVFSWLIPYDKTIMIMVIM